MHWGYEFEFFPRKKQVEIARQLVEEGADAIVCHHPHVAQPVEYYQTKRDPQRKAIIAYSLGSLTWGYSAPHLALSIVLNLELSKGHMHGRKCTYIASAKVTPVCRIYEQVEGKVITRIVKLSSLNADKTRISSRALKRFNSLAQLIRVPIR
jgi:poly-gamma-glutamate synthesis protein (capsule biosynthesis protein)